VCGAAAALSPCCRGGSNGYRRVECRRILVGVRADATLTSRGCERHLAIVRTSGVGVFSGVRGRSGVVATGNAGPTAWAGMNGVGTCISHTHPAGNEPLAKALVDGLAVARRARPIQHVRPASSSRQNCHDSVDAWIAAHRGAQAVRGWLVLELARQFLGVTLAARRIQRSSPHVIRRFWPGGSLGLRTRVTGLSVAVSVRGTL
jgi:hypothetical protein